MKKIYWHRREKIKPLRMVAQTRPVFDAVIGGLRDTDLDPVQNWCVENRCGVRVSFDQFEFRNEDELAFFLLKWS